MALPRNKARRGTEAQRTAITPEAGEFFFSTDTKRVHVGDGALLGGRTINRPPIVSQSSATTCYGPLAAVADMGATRDSTADAIEAIPIWIGDDFVMQDMLFQVTTQGGGTTTVGGALYLNSNGQPGTLFKYFGTTTVTTTGVKTIAAGAATRTPAGMYWACVCADASYSAGVSGFRWTAFAKANVITGLPYLINGTTTILKQNVRRLTGYGYSNFAAETDLSGETFATPNIDIIGLFVSQ